MVEVRVEILPFWDVDSLWGLVMVTGQNVVDVVDAAWSQFDLGKVGGPHPSVGILGLLLGVVGGVDPVVDDPVPVLPLLVIILFEVVVGRVDGEQTDHALLN